MIRRNARAGFTLVELLVVITIIGMLMAMALPATQTVLDAARRNGCAGNLRTIAQGVKTYESNHRSFPPGVATCMTGKQQHLFGGVKSGAICIGPTWAVAILTQLGENAMHQGVTKCLSATDKGETCGNLCESAFQERFGFIGIEPPRIMICPAAIIAEPLAGPSEQSWYLPALSKANYAANFGAGSFGDAMITEFDAKNPASVDKKNKTQGPFRVEVISRPGIDMRNLKGINDDRVRGAFKAGYGKGVTSQMIKDTLTTTIMLSEVVGVERGDDGRGCWTNGSMGASNFTAKIPPNADGTGGVPEWFDRIPICSSGAAGALKCEESRENRGKPDEWYAAARSMHTDGINVVFCDTNVRYIANTVNLERVWQRMATMRGGDSVEE